MRKFDLNNYNVFIFDCDGVILNSNKLKNILFLKSVIEYSPKQRDLFKKYISKNKGISRYKFFEYFFKNINFSKMNIQNASVFQDLNYL